MTVRENLLETVALSLFLARARSRRVLLEQRAEVEGDQRRGVDLPRAAARFRELPAGLREHGRRCRERAARLLDAAACGGIEAIGWHDARYPPQLAALDDQPVVVWLRGDPALLARPSVAIVGSRAASPYAVVVAERLASDVSGCGITVVSGCARGVDAAAHRGALGGEGATLAVLGSGVDIVYPAEHRSLAESIAKTGAVVSELPPGTPPRRHHFPRRNRLISGLARAVVVVEAGTRSGSLITARCAAEQGREVMAVPGNVLSGRSAGGHALIRDGAGIVEKAEDILEAIGLGPLRAAPTAAAQEEPDPVLRHMDPGETCGVDELIERSGLDSATVLLRLTELEIAGSVIRAGAGRFVRSSLGMLV
jgi:DNA processing protein